jgi:2-keto-4-pentenoate hydratase/2-oxohepta-3-ene-1,7-dioic acid hydratase in catechol pathway
MRLVSYKLDGGPLRAGALVGKDRVADLTAAVKRAGLSEAAQEAAGDTRGFLSLGPEAWDAVVSTVESTPDGELVDLQATQLGPPVENPEKIICLGLNYRDHAEETGMAIPSSPIVFAKFPNSLVGPADEIVLPNAVGDEVDYEAELAVVFGRQCRDVDQSQALEHLAGVMAFNDVSARELQMRTSQWTLGKAIDTFAPCGPALVSLDEIGDVQSLGIVARVNGETVQSGNTAAMIFGIAETIAFLSRLMTFVPGDVIATGTPAGVGMGRRPPLTLHPGDLVEVEIEGVGALRNTVVAQVGAMRPVLGEP